MTDVNTTARQSGPDIDYQTYRFGRRQRLYRGPAPDVTGRYVAFIGAERTFGKSVRNPFAAQLSGALGVPTANLAVEGAGAGFVLDDPVTMEACCRAEVCVIEVMGVWNVSNRLYSVGRRYNRRLRSVSPMLRGLYPKVDFDGFDYVGRMLEELSVADSEKFMIIERECRDAWMVRTRQLIESIETRTILFWFSERSPTCLTKQDSRRALSIYPEAVEIDMLERVKPLADAYVECIYAPNNSICDGPLLPSAPAHEAATAALSPTLLQMIGS